MRDLTESMTKRNENLSIREPNGRDRLAGLAQATATSWIQKTKEKKKEKERWEKRVSVPLEEGLKSFE
jgi:hypothetical protein